MPLAYCEGYGSHEEKDIHYTLFTLEHLKNHFEDIDIKNISTKYIEGEGKIINFILAKTRFSYMLYPHIIIKGIK